MKATPQAIAKATTQEIETETEIPPIPFSGTEVTTETKQVIITFGTLSFLITPNQIPNQRQEEILHGTNDNPLKVMHTGPGAPVHLNTISLNATPGTSKDFQAPTNPDKIKGASLTPQKANARPKFIKVPPATVHWQEAVSKSKNKQTGTRKIKQCLYCHKEGHTERVCWKKLKCYNCGKPGHKAAKCFYKYTKNAEHPNSSQNRQARKEIPKTAYQHKRASPMEFIHGRPPLRDVFCPPRLALDDENEYLCTVGLVVFTHGSPTPNFPQLMAIKMASEHGGRPVDYIISQAAITPYIIKCPSTQIRDTIIQ